MFHLDEYIGLPQQHPGSFSHFIEERIVRPTGIAHAHLLDGSADPYRVIDLVGRELLRAPVDVAFTGIGENVGQSACDPELGCVLQREKGRCVTV